MPQHQQDHHASLYLPLAFTSLQDAASCAGVPILLSLTAIMVIAQTVRASGALVHGADLDLCRRQSLAARKQRKWLGQHWQRPLR